MRRTAALLVALALALAGCSGGDDEPAADPSQLLADAKAVFDEAAGVHVSLTTDDVPSGTTAVIRGAGDLARPPAFSGTVAVQASGFTADVEVVSVGGKAYLKLPGTQRFVEGDPRDYGVGDPADLISPESGISSLLTSATRTSLGERARVEGEVVQPVSITLPGETVDRLLPSQDPSAEVTGVVDIATETNEVRRVRLTGPFYSAEQETTFTVVLTDYGKRVTITPPT